MCIEVGVGMCVGRSGGRDMCIEGGEWSQGVCPLPFGFWVSSGAPHKPRQ